MTIEEMEREVGRRLGPREWYRWMNERGLESDVSIDDMPECPDSMRYGLAKQMYDHWKSQEELAERLKQMNIEEFEAELKRLKPEGEKIEACIEWSDKPFTRRELTNEEKRKKFFLRDCSSYAEAQMRSYWLGVKAPEDDPDGFRRYAEALGWEYREARTPQEIAVFQNHVSKTRPWSLAEWIKHIWEAPWSLVMWLQVKGSWLN